jgi:hypothetical protein
METFERHRLNSLSEIDELVSRIGAIEFYSYQEIVFKILSALRPGNIYDIAGNIRPENIGIFIKCACVYMIKTAGDCNIVFSDDYSRIKGIQSFNTGRKEMQEYREQVKHMCNEKKQ